MSRKGHEKTRRKMNKWINEKMRLINFAEVLNFRKAGKHYSKNPTFQLSSF